MLKRLLRKWWFWVGFSTVTLLTLFIGGFYAEWKITRARGEARRDQVTKALDEEDPNWRAVELCAKRNATLPPAEQNIGDRAMSAIALSPESYKKWVNEERWRGELKPGHLADGEDICDALDIYEEVQPALKMARSIATLKQGGFKFEFKQPNPFDTLLDKTQKMREVASMLDLDALILAYEERGDEAILSSRAILNGCRGIGDEPTLISQLVRIAMAAIACKSLERTLSWCEPTQDLAELQSALLEEMLVNRMKFGLQGERASVFLMLQSMDDGLVSLDNIDGSPAAHKESLKSRVAGSYYRKFIPGQQAKIIEMLNQMLQASEKIGPERQAALDQIQYPPRGYENILVNLLIPACDKVMNADTRCRAMCGTAAVAIACERYRRQYGTWPVTLESIPKSILPQIPIDPYSGDLLKYQMQVEGPVVYAVGQDRIDNGGAQLDPKGDPGTDIGFKLFHTDQRRKPPLPKPPIFDPILEEELITNGDPTEPGTVPVTPGIDRKP